MSSNLVTDDNNSATANKDWEGIWENQVVSSVLAKVNEDVTSKENSNGIEGAQSTENDLN